MFCLQKAKIENAVFVIIVCFRFVFIYIKSNW